MAYTPFDSRGKVALITGGNSGIGLGMAKALADSGADVCIWGTTAQKNEKVLASLEALAGVTGRCNTTWRTKGK